jgi:hypothetical protein
LRFALLDPTHAKDCQLDLGGGLTLWAVYCPHVQAGSYAVMNDTIQFQWRTTSPTSRADFEAMLQALPAFYRGMRAGAQLDS